MTKEIKNRKEIIDWMNKTNIRGYKDVAMIIAQYSENPDEVIKKIRESGSNSAS